MCCRLIRVMGFEVDSINESCNTYPPIRVMRIRAYAYIFDYKSV